MSKAGHLINFGGLSAHSREGKVRGQQPSLASGKDPPGHITTWQTASWQALSGERLLFSLQVTLGGTLSRHSISSLGGQWRGDLTTSPRKGATPSRGLHRKPGCHRWDVQDALEPPPGDSRFALLCQSLEPRDMGSHTLSHVGVLRTQEGLRERPK